MNWFILHAHNWDYCCSKRFLFPASCLLFLHLCTFSHLFFRYLKRWRQDLHEHARSFAPGPIFLSLPTQTHGLLMLDLNRGNADTSAPSSPQSYYVKSRFLSCISVIVHIYLPWAVTGRESIRYNSAVWDLSGNHFCLNDVLRIRQHDCRWKFLSGPACFARSQKYLM